jgi:methyl-galactoside transport system substrate-binding protein
MTIRGLRGVAALAMAAALALPAALFPSCSRGGAPRPGIGVLMKSFIDPLCAGSRKAMEAAAAGKADLSFADSRGQAVTQEGVLEAAMSRKSKALVIDPVDEVSARVLVIKAKEKGIPVVFLGSRPGEDSMRSWDKVFYVGPRDSDAGAAQAEILAARWKADPATDRNRDGKIQLVLLAGESGLLQTLYRTESVVKALEGAGIGVDKLIEESARGSREIAKEKMASALARFGDRIEAVACNDDQMALGAVDACEAAGVFKGKRSIPIVGVCDSGDLKAIGGALESGKLMGTAFLDAPALGAAAISLALSLAKGEDPAMEGVRVQDAKYVWTPYKALTKESAAARR